MLLQRLTLLACCAAFLTLLLAAPALAEEAPRMDVDSLHKKLDDANVVVLDVRGMKYVKDEGGQKIKGAVLYEPGDADTWVAELDTSKTYILYCS